MSASLSTMWSQQDRFADLERFRETAAEFGYEAIEASHVTDEAGLGTLLDGGRPALSSLHAPTPHRFLEDGRHNGDANLASTDESQRAFAVSETKRTIEIAGGAGLPYVVVHLGGVGDRRNDLEAAIRLLYLQGETRGEAWEKARGDLREWRRSNVASHLEAARRSLEELVEYAASRSVAIGLESRLNYHEIPHPDEALDLLAPYDNGVAGFWYDTGHCEVQARLGLIDRDAWFPALTQRMLGCHLHDVNHLDDHRAPGNGTLDWSYVANALRPDALRVLEINQHEPDDLVAGAIAFLRERGILH